MKQTEDSNLTTQSDLDSSGPRKRKRTNQRFSVSNGKIFKTLLVILCVALFITIYVLANRNNANRIANAEYIPSVDSRALEVEVLDGVGSNKVAQRITNVLRSQGYDVLEMKKNSSGIVERSYILDRLGNIEAAYKLAEDIGIAQDKVFQKIDRNLYLDITIVVGKDYLTLKPFLSPKERNKN